MWMTDVQALSLQTHLAVLVLDHVLRVASSCVRCALQMTGPGTPRGRRWAGSYTGGCRCNGETAQWEASLEVLWHHPGLAEIRLPPLTDDSPWPE